MQGTCSFSVAQISLTTALKIGTPSTSVMVDICKMSSSIKAVVSSDPRVRRLQCCFNSLEVIAIRTASSYTNTTPAAESSPLFAAIRLLTSSASHSKMHPDNLAMNMPYRGCDSEVQPGANLLIKCQISSPTAKSFHL